MSAETRVAKKAHMRTSVEHRPKAQRRTPLDSKRKGRVAVGVCGVVLGIAYLLGAAQLEMGERAQPGPGTFPVLVGVAVIAVSMLTVGEAYFSAVVSGEVDLPKRSVAMYVGGFLLAVLGYGLILPHLGQYLSCALFMILTIKLLGPHGWVRSALYGVAAGFVISIVFVELLAIRMPAGIWPGPFQ